jgi:hypothetical protein
MRHHHGGSETGGSGEYALRLHSVTRVGHVVGPDRCWGCVGAAVALPAPRRVAALRIRHRVVVGPGRLIGRLGRAGAPISVIETESGAGATLPTAILPWSSAVNSPAAPVGAAAVGGASKELRMDNPDPRRKPPSGEPAAGQGRSGGRRPRLGPPGFTYEVQLLGGEAGRLLAQEQTEAIAAVLAWLAGNPPSAAVATGSAAARQARGAEHDDTDRDVAGPAEPSRRQHAEGTGGSGARRHLS